MWDMVTGEGEVLLLADLICHRCLQKRSKNDKKHRKKKMFLAQTSMFGHNYLHQHHGGTQSQSDMRTQILRLHRRQAVNIFIKCGLASICRYGSLMCPSGAGHQRTG